MATPGLPARVKRVEDAHARLRERVRDKARTDDETKLYLLNRVARIERDIDRHVKAFDRHVKAFVRMMQRCARRLEQIETRGAARRGD
jgi:hypothetical protein